MKIHPRTKSKLQNGFKVFIIFAALNFLNTEAYAICFGCGGQGGGNMPCFNAGDLMFTSCTSTPLNCEETYYQGNCIVARYIYKNGTMVSQSTFPGGCHCFKNISSYHPVTNPFAPFQSQVVPDTLKLTSPISLSRIEVWNLVNNGQIIYSIPDSVSANQAVKITNSTFVNGRRYVIVGYTMSGNADIFISVTKQQGVVSILKSFNSWGVQDSSDLQRIGITYVNEDTAMSYVQKLDKSGSIVAGTHNAEIDHVASLDLTCLVQGFYNPATNTMVSDSIRVYLRNTTPPFAIVDISDAAIAGPTGNAFIPLKAAGHVYIVVQHRNSIETWSKAGGDTLGIIIGDEYNFVTAPTQAYGSNMAQVDASPVRFAIYSGDVNQDDIVDGSDALIVDNDGYNFVTGYVSSDVTGDIIVDASDAAIVDNNGYNYVTAVRP